MFNCCYTGLYIFCPINALKILSIWTTTGVGLISTQTRYKYTMKYWSNLRNIHISISGIRTYYKVLNFEIPTWTEWIIVRLEGIKCARPECTGSNLWSVFCNTVIINVCSGVFQITEWNKKAMIFIWWGKRFWQYYQYAAFNVKFSPNFLLCYWGKGGGVVLYYRN